MNFPGLQPKAQGPPEKVHWGYLILAAGLVLVTLLILYNSNIEMYLTENRHLQKVPECNCKRSFFYGYPDDKNSPILNSSCSDPGSFYEPRQKVVSYSMYIGDPNDKNLVLLYKKGLTENLGRMRKHYPGSSLRLYTDMNLGNGSEYCRFVCENPDLHWCDVRKTPSLGDQSSMFFMTWRFLPLGDPTVDYFLSRDLDAAIIEREAVAVKEWLTNSSKAFHTMRDHPRHFAPIMGGVWGARNSLLGMKEAEALRNEIVKQAKKGKRRNRDQIILSQVIFNQKRADILAFDSYFCKRGELTKMTEVRPFPIQRKTSQMDFTGNYGLARGKHKDLKKCPVECRPEYGKHWEYC